MRGALLTVLSAGAFWQCLDSAILPPNPCPNLFQYQQDKKGDAFGRVMLDNDYSGNYDISVNMSIAAYFVGEQNLEIEMESTLDDILAGCPLVYHISFPIQGVIPRPTRIELNNKMYCTDPSEKLRTAGVTEMLATHHYRTNQPPKPLPAKPEQMLHPDCTLPTQQSPLHNSTTFPSNPWQQPSTSPTTAASLSLSTWQSPSTVSTTGAPRSSEPSMHSPKPIQVLDWLSLPPSVAVTTPASLIDEFSVWDKECGLTMVNSRSSVIEGDDFVDGQFPWLVAIMYRHNFDYNYKCTGSLVSNRHVITAGHCVKRNKEIGNFLLIFGTKNLPAPGAVQRELQNISVHPDYTDNKDDANVAILTVKDQIEFEASIKPVCLWHGEEYVVADVQGTVVGWWMDGKRKFVDAKKIDLPIVSQTKCLQSFPNLSSVVSSRTFCAGIKGAGPCHGDSGAGFFMQKNGRWTLKGVVFTAVGDLGSCDDDIDNYFVFVDVDKVMTWLKKVMT